MLPDSVVFALVFGGLLALYWIGKALQDRSREQQELEEWRRTVERQKLARERYNKLFKFPYDQDSD
jgi:hypothetical protein